MLNYRIFIDGKLIYSPYDDTYKIYDAKLELNQNDISTFEFTLLESKTLDIEILRMKSQVDVYQGDERIFKGIVIEDDRSMDNEVSIKCKDDLYYLAQTLQRPASYGSSTTQNRIVVNEDGDEVETSDDVTVTVPVAGIFKDYINKHNDESIQKFTIGNVEIEAQGVVENTDYKTTWDAISALISDYGGFLDYQLNGDDRVISWVKDFTKTAEQEARFSSNLTDVQINETALDMATVLIPTGDTVESSQVVINEDGDEEQVSTSTVTTIKDVNGGLDYIQDDEAVAKYGRIMKHKSYTGITDPQALLEVAKTDLAELVKHTQSITVKMIDLAGVDDAEDPIFLGKYIVINDPMNNIHDKYLPLKISRDLFNPENNEIELTATRQTQSATAFNGTINSASTGLVASTSRRDSEYMDIVKAQKGYIDELHTKTLDVEYLLTSFKGKFKVLESDSAKIKDLETDFLQVNGTANINKTNIDKLNNKVANIDTLTNGYARIGVLDNDLANIKSLLAGNVNADGVQSIVINSQNSTIANGVITNAMIQNLSFDKITGFDINTTKLTIHSADGRSTWKDNTIQIKDANNKLRVQLGKDAKGDYTIYLYDKDGKVLFDPLGLTADGINRQVIDNDAVMDNAMIAGSKLDIDDVIKEVNGAKKTIKSSRIYFDDQKQTLNVVLNSITESTSSAVTTADAANSTANQANSIANLAKATAENTSNSAVKNITVEYAVNTSNSTAPTTGWALSTPKWSEGSYIWSRTVATRGDGTNVYSDPTCVTGHKGATGAQGLRGIQGPKGDQGIQGVKGNDGYSPTVSISKSGSASTISITDKSGTHTTTVLDGAKGTPGTKGADGRTTYFHVKYSNDGGKTFTTNNGEAIGDYIGTRTDFTEADSNTVTDYTWARIKGEQGAQGLRGLQGEKGDQGIPGQNGTNGTNGKTSYFHVKYSLVANPTSSSQLTETPSTYIGTYVDFTEADSTDPTRYTWTQFKGSQGAKGDQGIAGKNGIDGKTYYLHIAYANSSDGSSGFSTSDSKGKLYLGQCTDLNQADPTTPASYQWSLIKGDKGLGVKAVVPQYYLSTSSASQSSGSWTETQPAWTSGKYIWTRSKVTWDDNSVTYSSPILANGINSANDKANQAYNLANTANAKTIETSSSLETVSRTVTDNKNGVKDLMTRTSQVETNVTNLKDLENTHYSTVTTQYNNQQKTIDGTVTRLGNAENRITTVSNELSNLSIGGRNLFEKSGKLTSDESCLRSAGSNLSITDRTTGTDAKTESGQYIACKISNPGGGGVFLEGLFGNYTQKLKGGEVYTVSVYAKADKNYTVGSIIVEWMDRVDNVICPNYSTEWQRYIVTGRARADPTGSYIAITFYPPANTFNDTVFYISSPKVEIGNRPTAWSPAPEDFDNKITEQSNALATYKQTIDQNLAQISSTYQRKDGMSNYATNSSVTSAINQAKDQINSSVSSNYVKTSDYNTNKKALEDRMSSAEQNITDSAIVSTVKSSHDWSELQKNASKLDWQIRTDALDLNDMKTDGRYLLKGGLTNAYSGCSGWQYLIVESVPNQSRVTQTMWHDNGADNTGYTRKLDSSGSWTPWVREANTANAISVINQSSESIKIQANRIDIDGLVTFNGSNNAIANKIADAKTAAKNANTNAENQKYYRIIECASHSNDYPGTGIWLKINNVQQILNNRSRGLNVASINPITLAVEGTWGFDTFAGGDNITNFNSKIAELNGGDHIIVVMSYDASYPSRVADALRSIGGTVYTPGSSYRESYVLIGKSNLGYGNGVERYNPAPASNKWQAIASCRVSENGALMSSNSGSLASYTKVELDEINKKATATDLLVSNWCNLNDKTLIDGSKIYTGTITADKLNVNEMRGTNGVIYLKDGTFDYGSGKLKWDGSSLTINGKGSFSGSISASTITGGTISGTTISGVTISGATLTGDNTWFGKLDAQAIQTNSDWKTNSLGYNIWTGGIKCSNIFGQMGTSNIDLSDEQVHIYTHYNSNILLSPSYARIQASNGPYVCCDGNGVSLYGNANNLQVYADNKIWVTEHDGGTMNTGTVVFSRFGGHTVSFYWGNDTDGGKWHLQTYVDDTYVGNAV